MDIHEMPAIGRPNAVRRMERRTRAPDEGTVVSAQFMIISPPLRRGTPDIRARSVPFQDHAPPQHGGMA